MTGSHSSNGLAAVGPRLLILHIKPAYFAVNLQRNPEAVLRYASWVSAR